MGILHLFKPAPAPRDDRLRGDPTLVFIYDMLRKHGEALARIERLLIEKVEVTPEARKAVERAAWEKQIGFLGLTPDDFPESDRP